MKKTLFALTLAASLGLAACSDSGEEAVVSSKVGDITKDEYYNELKTIAGTQFIEQMMIEKVLADKYEVTDEEVQAEFDDSKAQMGESFEAALAQYGYTEETYKATIRSSLLQKKAMMDVEISDEEIQTYFDENYGEGKEVNARHILVEDEATANKLVEELNAGADFATLAEENSQDPGSAANGGNLDWFGKGQMVAEFEEVAFSLAKDEISAPVKTDYGYHIIQVLDTRDITLEDKEEEIREAIATSKVDLNEVIGNLLKEANVKVNDPDLEDAFSTYLNAGEEESEEETESAE